MFNNCTNVTCSAQCISSRAHPNGLTPPDRCPHTQRLPEGNQILTFLAMDSPPALCKWNHPARFGLLVLSLIYVGSIRVALCPPAVYVVRGISTACIIDPFYCQWTFGCFAAGGLAG